MAEAAIVGDGRFFRVLGFERSICCAMNDYEVIEQ